MVTVAIAAENLAYDGEIYRVLLELVLKQGVAIHPSQLRFTGWRSVLSLSGAYLADAAQHGIRHALFAVDNDGGAKRAPEHDSAHDTVFEAVNPNGCRVCLVSANLPQSWTAGGNKRCVVVPVQALETWLLCIRGDEFTAPTPEQQYDRPVLKKRFFGKPEPPTHVKLTLALAEIRKPHALDVLRQRRSFRQFEEQLADWP